MRSIGKKMYLACALFVAMNPALRAEPASTTPISDEQVIKNILDRGGKVTRDENAKDKPVTEIVLDNKKFGDADLRLVKRFNSLGLLILWGSEVTDDGMKELAGMKSLHTIIIDTEWSTGQPRYVAGAMFA